MLKRLTDGEQISIKMCTACATRLDLCTSALGTATTTEVSTQRTSLTTPHSRSSINGLIAVSPEATFVPPSQTDSDFRPILPTADQVLCCKRQGLLFVPVALFVLFLHSLSLMKPASLSRCYSLSPPSHFPSDRKIICLLTFHQE